MAFSFKVVKGGSFKLVPEGRQLLTVTEVELVPRDKPMKVLFKYSHESGATLRESFKLNEPKAQEILGIRADIATNGNLEAGTELSVTDIPDLFLGKTFDVTIVHKVYNDKTYANIKYYNSLVPDDWDPQELEEEDDL